MSEPTIVSREDWLNARKALLEQEKALTRQRDAVAAARRALPWVAVHADYRFQTATGEETLLDLFQGRSQLIVYHFMFGPEWEVGCKSCSYLTDHLQGAIPHLNARDVTLAVVSRAPLERLQAFQTRMGWTHRWVSSLGSRFNFDYGVSYTAEQIESKELLYNFGKLPATGDESPGISVFVRRGDAVFHTWSAYARGLDDFINAYTLFDTLPRGRDEQDLPWPMSWVRHHDAYGEE